MKAKRRPASKLKPVLGHRAERSRENSYHFQIFLDGVYRKTDFGNGNNWFGSKLQWDERATILPVTGTTNKTYCILCSLVTSRQTITDAGKTQISCWCFGLIIISTFCGYIIPVTNNEIR